MVTGFSTVAQAFSLTVLKTSASDFPIASSPFHPVKDFTKAVERVRKACEDVGRDPDSLVYSAAVNVDVKANSTTEILDELGAFKEAGAQRAYLQLLDLGDTEQVRLLAAEVKPHL